MENRRLSDIINFSKSLTILIVEDEEAVLNQVVRSFKTLFSNIIIATNGQEALEKYVEYYEQNNKFIDIIFTDLNLPILSGLDFCEKVKKYNEKQIIIATSAYADVNKLQKIIEIGIYNFIPKPIIFHSLYDILIKSLEKIKEEKKLNELKEELDNIKNENLMLFELASLDKLTNLYNRRYLDDILEKYAPTDFSIIFTDIDDFKNINDVHGHQIGDYVLIKFAKLLKEHTRNYDVVGRWGGEEFIIVLKETPIETTLFIAEKLRKAIQEENMYEDIKITSSFGISKSSKEQSLNDIIHNADKNLYNAKKLGKNKISYNFEIYTQEDI